MCCPVHSRCQLLSRKSDVTAGKLASSTLYAFGLRGAVFLSSRPCKQGTDRKVTYIQSLLLLPLLIFPPPPPFRSVPVLLGNRFEPPPPPHSVRIEELERGDDLARWRKRRESFSSYLFIFVFLG